MSANDQTREALRALHHLTKRLGPCQNSTICEAHFNSRINRESGQHVSMMCLWCQIEYWLTLLNALPDARAPHGELDDWKARALAAEAGYATVRAAWLAAEQREAVLLDALRGKRSPSDVLGWMDSEGPVIVAPGRPATPTPGAGGSPAQEKRT